MSAKVVIAKDYKQSKAFCDSRKLTFNPTVYQELEMCPTASVSEITKESILLANKQQGLLNYVLFKYFINII